MKPISETSNTDFSKNNASFQQSMQRHFRNECIYYSKNFQNLSKANSKTHFYNTGVIVYRNGLELFFHSKTHFFLMPEPKRFLEAKPKNISGQPQYNN